MKIVGLTGGIGSGKSAVADVFLSLGIQVIDTDKIAHQLTAVGGIANPSIGEVFGAEMLESAGGMARSKMRELVFNDPSARQKLEAILHPLIGEAVNREIRALTIPAPYAILAVPLLFERMTFRTLIWRTLTVDCTIATQISRVKSRSNLLTDEINRFINAQAPRQIRLQLADDVIHNEAGLTELRGQVEAFHRRLIAIK
ncbi:MAG: dephospho-CoA kinase [Gammaproteobacteria bacterium]|nr:dephospho-CoA kinase [Gammaproteobacteria bacterium]